MENSIEKLERILGEDSFVRVPKVLIRNLKSLTAAVVLMEFYSWRNLLYLKEKISSKEESFYLLYNQLMEQLGFSQPALTRAINLLVELGYLIFDKKIGIPPITYYKFNDKKLLDLIVNG